MHTLAELLDEIRYDYKTVQEIVNRINDVNTRIIDERKYCTSESPDGLLYYMDANLLNFFVEHIVKNQRKIGNGEYVEENAY